MTKDMTKDEGIAALAVAALMRGERVVYVTTRAERMRRMFDRMVAAAPTELVQRVSLGRGDERIQARNGGSIQVRTPHQGARGATADVVLLDEVSDQVAQYGEQIVAGSDIGQVHRYVREES